MKYFIVKAERYVTLKIYPWSDEFDQISKIAGRLDEAQIPAGQELKMLTPDSKLSTVSG